ncbi:Hypothetical predicted protein [Xyrichtys novacula]|uniref:Uncharacterized protein n=1 Tax=Xyrichtys novacula TaxID=13765 RepID=A0AAV1GQG9_XYRNO|nr:Hypothetical predicted protein [Xyrichtys novacula]
MQHHGKLFMLDVLLGNWFQQVKQVGVQTLRKLLLLAAVRKSTSGQACSQDEKMYS